MTTRPDARLTDAELRGEFDDCVDGESITSQIARECLRLRRACRKITGLAWDGKGPYPDGMSRWTEAMEIARKALGTNRRKG